MGGISETPFPRATRTDITGMQISVAVVVNQEHMQERVQSEIGETVIVDAAALA